ncbi:uncharacterized protein PHALS_01696 [Plasmopara halstedii]|uniref:Uncharacterized protein n=1 Tax=Plasmopara halstedii TaxID=4781 RepID=A0A0P1AU12_PLAHL|nr:uncharacterized protein PHALS_01696 [Plasmopara halstedii]CEG45397.1 hypothetical protein PHALS_01696 [Plasmopara halstedii]|eukprot:XP_024581766.1 hypothetical protein PHALS_01696 [Plasmopara halstedii]
MELSSGIKLISVCTEQTVAKSVVQKMLSTSCIVLVFSGSPANIVAHLLCEALLRSRSIDRVALPPVDSKSKLGKLILDLPSAQMYVPSMGKIIWKDSLRGPFWII